MNRTTRASGSKIIYLCVLANLALLTTDGSLWAYVPWDPLVNDNWVWNVASNPDGIAEVNLYTVNGGYNGGVYPVLFDPKRSNGGARGMNALVFQYQGIQTGHLASNNLTDSFKILNIGDHNIFDYVILGIAIQASSLSGDFELSLDVSGGNSWNTSGSNDFVYYDEAGNDTGRPSGYYSATNPTFEPVAYDFSAGMACLIDTGVVLNPSGGNATISYSFNNLPGRAVFSVYGFVSTDNPASIYHTNRAVTDNKDPLAPLSTFEVIPEPSCLLMILSVGGLLGLKRGRSVERGE